MAADRLRPRRPFRAPRSHALLAALVLAGLAGGEARAPSGASGAESLLAGADPDVRAALTADGGGAARQALGSLLGGRAVPRETIALALGNRDFAPHARDTLVAMAKVAHLPGALETFERVGKSEGAGLAGPAFEIQVAASFGERAAAISAKVDGHEVDVVLRDGTLVEAKFQHKPDPGGIAADRVIDKAIEQLALRGANGADVMLVTNLPLEAGDIQRVRRKLGETSGVAYLRGGTLRTQLAPRRALQQQRMGAARLGRAPHRARAGARRVTRAAHRKAHRARTHRAGRQPARARSRAR